MLCPMKTSTKYSNRFLCRPDWNRWFSLRRLQPTVNRFRCFAARLSVNCFCRRHSNNPNRCSNSRCLKQVPKRHRFLKIQTFLCCCNKYRNGLDSFIFIVTSIVVFFLYVLLNFSKFLELTQYSVALGIFIFEVDGSGV